MLARPSKPSSAPSSPVLSVKHVQQLKPPMPKVPDVQTKIQIAPGKLKNRPRSSIPKYVVATCLVRVSEVFAAMSRKSRQRPSFLEVWLPSSQLTARPCDFQISQKAIFRSSALYITGNTITAYFVLVCMLMYLIYRIYIYIHNHMIYIHKHNK